MIRTIFGFLTTAIIQGTPLLYGATGEIVTEKSGNLNLGIPGIMYMGGISGIIGAYFYEHSTTSPNPFLCILIPFLSSLLGSALLAFIYSFLTITLRVNQNVTGLALTTLGVGIGNFFGASLMKLCGETGSISLYTTGNYYKTILPFASKLGLFGETFLSFGFMVYLAVILAVIFSYVLNHNRIGLNLRSIGENPATADAAGINVTRYKYISTIIGGAVAGLGGLYWVMDYTTGGWSNDGFGDRGWLAIAIVIFAIWRPNMAIFSSYLFGGLYIFSVKTQISWLNDPVVREILEMSPYVVTILVLIAVSVRKKRENQPPASLGLSYFREER